MNIPNLLSISRLLIMPILVWLIISNQLMIAFWLFFLAGLSDAADGIIAKKFNMITQLGSYLDPLADKTLLVSVFFTLGMQNYVPFWLVLLIICREALIIGGAIVFRTLTRSLTMKPLSISKINTFLQVILAGFILGHNGYEVQLAGLEQVLIIVVSLTTIVSGMSYVVIWTMHASKIESDEGQSIGEERDVELQAIGQHFKKDITA